MKASIVFLALVACAIATPVAEKNGLADILAERGGINAILFPDSRIVGGELTTIQAFPWIVTMQRFGSHRCGASIISPNRILTAAHCTVGIAASTLQVRAGSTFSQQAVGQLVQVSAIINHPQYNPRTLDNDITVMQLGGWLSTGSGVAVIPMPGQGAGVPTGALAWVAGWGHLWQGGSNSPQLRAVGVPIVDQGTCNAQYGGGITAGMLCAGFPQGGRDACQNDSGGPLSLNGQLVGVVSWGRGCAQPNASGVYARVAFYRNWINSHL